MDVLRFEPCGWLPMTMKSKSVVKKSLTDEEISILHGRSVFDVSNVRLSWYKGPCLYLSGWGKSGPYLLTTTKRAQQIFICSKIDIFKIYFRLRGYIYKSSQLMAPGFCQQKNSGCEVKQRSRVLIVNEYLPVIGSLIFWTVQFSSNAPNRQIIWNNYQSQDNLRIISCMCDDRSECIFTC